MILSSAANVVKVETEVAMSKQSGEFVLVTGGAGFLGAHIVRALLQDSRYRDFSILVIDDLSGGFRENLPQNARVQFRELSIVDHVAMDAVFEEYSISYVFHLAAYAAEGLSHFIRRFNYQNNLVGSVNLINAAVRSEVKHFVFTSSIAVYGAGQVPMSEETVPRPEDPYGIAKFVVELDLQAAAEMFDLPYTIFRPHNVYGEYQNIGDRYRNVVGIFMNRILQNQPLPVFGDGSQQRAFTYVHDLMLPMVSAPFESQAVGEAFNIGATQPVSVRELAEIVSEEFGVALNLDLQPARNEVHLAWSDHAKCDRVFGSSANTSLRDGVRRMAVWAGKAGARSSTSFKGIEIERGLPPIWQS